MKKHPINLTRYVSPLLVSLVFCIGMAQAQQVATISPGVLVISGSLPPSFKAHTEGVKDTVLLTPRSDLYFTAGFHEPLIAQLQRLAPELSRDSLHRKGNFRFALMVDGREVYASELLPGAPQPAMQDTAIMLARVLVDNKNGNGSWSESFWNRFMFHGGQDALTDGDHLLRMEIRSYVRTDALHIGPVMASGEAIVRVSLHPRIDVSKITLNRIVPDGDLNVSKARPDTDLLKTLKGKIEAGEFRKVNGIVVLREGRILVEEYFNGSDRQALHDTRSVGKSFVSALTGLAIGSGHLAGVDARLGDLYDLGTYANPDPNKASVTLRSLLTMGSGFDGDDEDDDSRGNEENMYPTSDWVKFALDLPMRKDDGKAWHYFTAGAVLLGDIVNKHVPGGLESFADSRLFHPLGIHSREWQYTPQHVPNTAGGLRLRALDLARFGQLYKNRGIWNGKRILDAAWVDSSLAPLVRISGREDEFYGYLFWNRKFKVGERSYEASYCAGNGGNYVLIFKDQPLVIVITASAYGQPYAHPQVKEMLEKYILPAVVR